MQKSHFRTEYEKSSLPDEQVPEDPFALFKDWFDEAVREVPRDPNAMSLATVGSDGRPQVRVVLCKEFGPEGFVFFTNYESRKGGDLAAHPDASLLFFWASLERQVRINGRTRRIPAEQSDAYFRERPRAAQIGAWASAQSRPITHREVLENSVAQADQRFAGQTVPRPGHWGGYLLVPDEFEFWQGRSSRLHDRIVFRLAGADLDAPSWSRSRLAP